MLGTIPLAEVLDMLTPDDDETHDAFLPMELEDRPFNPMMRGSWGPFRPAA